jgi:Copper type II ascorbate-dependent monooxygenase, C-terminal domain
MLKSIFKTGLFATVVILSACTETWEYDPNEIPNDFAPLAAPAAGQGYQIHVPAFPIPAQFERELYVRMPLGNTEKTYLSAFEVKQRDGSHHVIAYGFEDENAQGIPTIGEIRDQNGPDGKPNFFANPVFTRLVAEAAAPYAFFQFPEGFGLEIKANTTYDINSHYFNKTDKTRFGEIYFNFFTKPESEIDTILLQEDIDNGENLILPPNSTKTISHSELFEEDRHIKVMFSHMHKRGELFEVFYVGGPKDGQKLYSWDDWHDPNFLTNADPIFVSKGNGLRTEITYTNETNQEKRFGVTSEDEMGIFFYYYY